jgi:hypothetical protein
MSISTLVVNENELSTRESDRLTVNGAQEMNRSARTMVVATLLLGILFLVSLGAFVFSGIYRFQDCL